MARGVRGKRRREGKREGEVLCCWIIHLSIEPAAIWGWISAATDVCGVKIAGVGWWSAGGGCRDERYGERERDGEHGRDGSRSLRMHNEGENRSKSVGWDLGAVVHTQGKKDTKVLRLRVCGFYAGGHHSACRCITPMTFASAHQWNPAKLDSIGGASTAVAPDRMKPCCNPQLSAALKSTIRHQSAPTKSAFSISSMATRYPADLLAGVGRVTIWEGRGVGEWWPDDLFFNDLKGWVEMIGLCLALRVDSTRINLYVHVLN